MNRIFIYFSDTGNGDAVAARMQEKGFAIRKAVPKKPLAKSFVLKILQGGFLAGLGAKAPLRSFDSDVSAFDEVVVGSPIWNGRLSCPINTVLAETDLSGKKVAFVLYSGSGEAPKAEAKLKAAYPNATILHMTSPLTKPEELEKLAVF